MTVRRPLILTPLAMFAAACGMRPIGAFAPSDYVTNGPQPPGLRSLALPARADALGRWQLPSGDPWASYAKYTLLTALDEAPSRTELPDVASFDEVQRAWEAGARVGAAGVPPDTLWIVDMRGAASVSFGVALSQDARGRSVSLVPTFNNWPAENELIPAEETLAALAGSWPKQSEDGAVAALPVFLLDAWRLAYRYDEPDDETYDNRYALSPSDLPDVATLRVHGIHRVVYVVQSLGHTTVEEDDLHDSFVAWTRAGVTVAMVDLESLAKPAVGARWDALLAENQLLVEPRVTILEEPSFYVRAHGGFGGGHARLSPGLIHVGSLGHGGGRGRGGGRGGIGGGRGGRGGRGGGG
jgi:hypothetical protein